VIDIKWIFSGVGVPAVVALVLFIKSRLKKKSPAPIQNLDPVAIIGEIEAAPFLHRPETAKRYVGARVEWSGQLYFAEETMTRGQARLQLYVPDTGHKITVWFVIKSKDYPGLNLLHDQSQIRFRGTIVAVQGSLILLKDVKLLEW